MMKLYRFSPITTKAQLMKAILHTHMECHRLCRNSFSKFLPVAGNIGIFCHYDEEYEFLDKLRKELCEESDNINQKYFRLHKPIIIDKQGNIPRTVYTYLYIRKPDPYRAQVGDVDFVLDAKEYDLAKTTMLNGQPRKGARVFPRGDLDMIELFHPDVDALGYVTKKETAEKVREKQN